jgi:hypothetical protein
VGLFPAGEPLQEVLEPTNERDTGKDAQTEFASIFRLGRRLPLAISNNVRLPLYATRHDSAFAAIQQISGLGITEPRQSRCRVGNQRHQQLCDAAG